MLNRLVEDMRLASFRAYLAATVHSMTSIVPDVLDLAGSSVGDAMQRLRPGPRWPSITLRKVEHGQAGVATERMIEAGMVCPWRPAPLIGDAVISDGVPGAFVEAKIYGDSLDVKLCWKGAVLFTHRGTGYVMLDQQLPDIVVTGCCGRRLLDVIDHPLLRSSDLVIAAAAQVGGASSFAFEIGRSRLDVPWRP